MLAHCEIARGDAATLDQLMGLAQQQERLTASLPENHPHRSGTMLLMGHLRMARGELDAAEENLRSCVAMREATLSPDHRLIAYARSVLGECLLRQGRRDEALPMLLSSYEALRRGYGEHAGWTVDARARLAMAKQ
jgi:serine/threonine-protein kinase